MPCGATEETSCAFPSYFCEWRQLSTMEQTIGNVINFWRRNYIEFGKNSNFINCPFQFCHNPILTVKKSELQLNIAILTSSNWLSNICSMRNWTIIPYTCLTGKNEEVPSKLLRLVEPDFCMLWTIWLTKTSPCWIQKEQ